MARRVAVPDRVLDMGSLHVVDYQDSYVVDAPAALAFGSIPAWLRGLIAAVHRSVLGVQLDVTSTVPVPGWRRLRGEPDEVIYGADGRLLTPRLVVSVTSTTVRTVWALVGPVHRVIARVLLDGVCGRIAVTGRADGGIEFAIDDGPHGVLTKS